MILANLPGTVREPNYVVREWAHASTILQTEFAAELSDIVEILSQFKLLRSEIVAGGGAESRLTKRIQQAFRDKNWDQRTFTFKSSISDLSDYTELESESHTIDCFKGRIALEIEWNSKDQTFDRDIAAFRRLFDAGLISVGVIITRDSALQGLFSSLGWDPARGKPISAKYGASTTHMSKLIDHVKRVGATPGFPLLAFGISRGVYLDDLGTPIIPPPRGRSRQPAEESEASQNETGE